VTSAAEKMSTDFNSEIQAELAGMGPEQQQRILEFVRALRGDHAQQREACQSDALLEDRDISMLPATRGHTSNSRFS
jgi:hypothetical protein